jgi:hypothetical protein
MSVEKQSISPLNRAAPGLASTVEMFVGDGESVH